MTLRFLLEYKFVLTFLASSDQKRDSPYFRKKTLSLNIYFVKKIQLIYTLKSEIFQIIS